MSNKKFKVTVKESKKSEAAESEFIQDFRSYMDTMDGEPYSEDDLIGWGWEWLSEKEEYPNGTKTCVTTYTMTDNGVKYMLVVRWNSFMETIDGYELTQESESESKKSEGLPPKRLGSKRQYRSRADLINKMKQLGAVEITTSKQFNDIKNSQWLHTAGYALDTNGNLVAQSYYGDKDGKWYYTSTRNFDSDYLPESKQHENRTKEEEVTNIFKGMKEWADRWSNSDKDRKTIADNLDLEAVQENMSDIVEILDGKFEWDGYGFKFPVAFDYSEEDDGARDAADADQWNTCYDACAEIAELIGIPDDDNTIGAMNEYFWEEVEQTWRDDDSKSAESKKSESLSLKQKELKDMVRYGEAEDITTISDAEAKELRKKGIELVGVSRGTYGMNGALLRDNEGKKYAITARSSNLFYFV